MHLSVLVHPLTVVLRRANGPGPRIYLRRSPIMAQQQNPNTNPQQPKQPNPNGNPQPTGNPNPNPQPNQPNPNPNPQQPPVIEHHHVHEHKGGGFGWGALLLAGIGGIVAGALIENVTRPQQEVPKHFWN